MVLFLPYPLCWNFLDITLPTSVCMCSRGLDQLVHQVPRLRLQTPVHLSILEIRKLHRTEQGGLALAIASTPSETLGLIRVLPSPVTE